MLIFLLLFPTFLFASDVTFIATHPGPAEHFVAYAKLCDSEKITTRIFAEGAAFDKFQKAGLGVQKISNISALSQDKILLIDGSLPEELLRDIAGPCKVLYYDNFEAYVPGGYSKNVRRMSNRVDALLFASVNLEDAPLFDEKGEIEFKGERLSVGYYPLEERKLNLLYLGGASKLFYEEALPCLLEALKDFDIHLVYLQHPRARLEGSPDIEMIQKNEKKWTWEISSSFDEALRGADCVLYYQTSMIPSALLAGKKVIQVAPLPYPDFALRRGLVKTASNASELQEALFHDRKQVLDAIGYCFDWKARFLKIIKELKNDQN